MCNVHLFTCTLCFRLPTAFTGEFIDFSINYNKFNRYLGMPCDEKKGQEGKDGGEKKLKPCCACPETKKVRDEWYAIMVSVTETRFPGSFSNFFGIWKLRNWVPSNQDDFIIPNKATY